MQFEAPLVDATEKISDTEKGSMRTDGTSYEDGVDLIQVFLLLWQNRKIILRFTLITMFVTALYACFVMKPFFTAKAVFLPPQSAPGSAMTQLAGQLGALGGLGGLGGIKSSGDVYVGMLGSRTIADALIHRFDLQHVYKTKKLSDTETILKSTTKVVAGKDSLITISVDDRDPNRAADIANGYLDALYDLNGRLALTESAQRRLFFEQQLIHEKDALADAEVELKRTQEQTGLISPSGQTEGTLEAIDQLRAQITSRQVEMSVLQQGATERNPEVVRVQTEIENLQAQVRKLENDSSLRSAGNIQTPLAKVPELGLEYIRKQREVKYHETLFELLARQYESAKLDESREATVLQVVDRAVVPDKKSGPHRALLTLGGMLLGFFVGSLWVILSSFLKKKKSDLASLLRA